MAMRLEGDARAAAVAAIQEHFRSQRGEDLGQLGAGILLGFVEDELAPVFYNRGVADAKALVQRLSGAMLEELEYLEVVPKAPLRRSGA